MFFLKPIKSCCCCFFLVIILIVGGGAIVVAKTGLVKIPFVSDWFYTQPEPNHQVEVSETASRELEQNVTAWATTSGRTNTSTPLVLTEANLTQAIRQAITSNQAINPETLQVSVVDGSLELFGQLRQPFNTFITMDFKPMVSDAGIELGIEHFKVGQLELPIGIVRKLFDGFIQNTLVQTYEQTRSVLTIESLTVTPAGLQLMAFPNFQQNQ